MCELLLRVVDKVNANPYEDCQCLKRGDVVVIQPDGWAWGPDELRNVDWRIIKLPGIAADMVSALVAPELPVDPINPSKVLQKRGFHLDVDNTLSLLPPAVKAYLLDSTRASPSYTFNVTLSQILSLKLTKPALVDPNILV